MKRRELLRSYKFLGGLQATIIGLAAVVPASHKIETTKWTDSQFTSLNVLGELAKFLQEASWYLTPVLLLLAGALSVAKRMIGDPATWGTVHELLDQFRAHIFSNAGAPNQDDHRVTLFRRQKWALVRRRWPWSGWLRVVERSGHTAQSSDTIFMAGDRSEKCEGVAGWAWIRDRAPYIKELPDVSRACPDSDLEYYGKNANLTVSRIRSKRPKGRSFYAIRVEVKSRPWGVIVIDSRDTTLKIDRIRKHYKAVGRLLERLLERV